ncbi:ATP-binding protein [Antrihabitans sp. NCIMB 15449]|jgi:ATP-dependent DNA helicase RecG|uniref:ATP-binding protein n=1 Tax=Antrihabitans spumae TaxID=3373370 RepID=A0ABW7JI27_9NOCA
MFTDSLVATMRAVGADLHSVEVKSAAGGFPSDVVETLSAFANGGGGTLILGLDESAGFTPAVGFDANKIRDALAGACADKMNPPLRLAIEIEEFESALVVRADVSELDPIAKPCFVEARGAYQGSFIRSGDGDRRLTHYEVTQLLANRTQPRSDLDVVEEAELDDLESSLVADLVERARRRSPRAFAELDDATSLLRLGAVARASGGVLRPTVGGLLALGVYPQQFFPQLFVSVVVLPGTRMGEQSPDGARFLDNQTITGPIPVMVLDAVAALIRNMRKAAIIRGISREDRYDYPLDVIRELVVNALMHRDYSPEARGAQVQIELYVDRLVVKSPGGLYGSISVDMLGSSGNVNTSRNHALAAILADLSLPGSRGESICENRGSGLPQVMESLRQAGMSPPTFDAAPGRLMVTVPQHALLSPDTVEWIGSLRQRHLTDSQHLALAMMRTTGRTTNTMLQAWGVAPVSAGQALRDLVIRGLAVSTGGRRYASYQLAASVPSPFDLQVNYAADEQNSRPPGIEMQRDAILQAIQAGHTTTRALSILLGVTHRTVARRIAELIEAGAIEPLGPRRSSKQSYRLVHKNGEK